MPERFLGYRLKRNETEKTNDDGSPIDHDISIQSAQQGNEIEDKGYAEPYSIGVFDGLSSSYSPATASGIALDHFYAHTHDIRWKSTQKYVETHLRLAWNDSLGEMKRYKVDYGLLDDQNPATTVTVAQVFEEEGKVKVSLVHSGHSRLYRVTANGTFELLTTDHSQRWDMAANQVANDPIHEPDFSHMDPFEASKRQDRYQQVVTSWLSPEGKINPDVEQHISYELKTIVLPKGTIALIAQTIGVHSLISAEEEAKAIRGATSAKDAATRILRLVNARSNEINRQAEADEASLLIDPRERKAKDASVAIIQLEPFPKKVLVPRSTVVKTGLVAAATLFAGVTTFYGRQQNKEIPPPPPPTEQPKPAEKPTSDANNEQITLIPSDVYADIPLTSYHPGNIRVDLSKRGGLRIRTAPSTSQANIINPATITKINGETIDISRGVDTFIITNAPLVNEQNVNHPDPWIVLIATMSDEEKKPVYINAGKATKGVVDAISDEDEILHEELNKAELKTNLGQRLNEHGEPITIGNITIR